MARVFLVLGAIFGLLAVVLGAFGAHGLKARVSPDLLQIFETGARYHMYHAFLLMFIGSMLSTRPSAVLVWAGIATVAGVLIFSGSLYMLVLTDTRWLGAITPIGGLMLIAGWGLLAFALATNP